MPRSVDLTGRRFGKLIALAPTDKRMDEGSVVWLCQCDCGKQTEVSARKLTRGTVTNCGCRRKTSAHNGTIAEDLTGRRFGILTVIRRDENKNNRTRWLCRCDCGNQCIVMAQHLKFGHTKSCGCQRVWDLPDRKKDIAGMKIGRLTVLCATEKRDAKGSVFWHCRCNCGNELDVTEDCLIHGNYRSCGCLKQEFQASIGKQLTFVDGTCVEWLQSRKSRSDNTSGFRGVYQASNGKWKAGIGLQKKRYYLGTYSTFEEAVSARIRAEELLHDGFLEAYHTWESHAEGDPDWAETHPFYFRVTMQNGDFRIISNETQ